MRCLSFVKKSLDVFCLSFELTDSVSACDACFSVSLGCGISIPLHTSFIIFYHLLLPRSSKNSKPASED